jgi:hypothetical protein
MFMDINYKIIAVDFDGTLCYSNWPELGAPNTMLIDYLLQEKAAGNKLILWTCRAGKALTDATEWCCEQGLTFDAVNDNLPEIVELYGNNSRKITCDLYIDDKSAFIDSMGRIRGAGL